MPNKPIVNLVIILILSLEIVIILMLLIKLTELTDSIDLTNKEKLELPQCPYDFRIPSENPNLMFELKPNYKGCFDGFNVKLPRTTTIEINSDGIRDREFSVEKPPNVFRIVVLGDSFAFGQGVENNETFAKVLETFLNNNSKKWKYEVLNFGVPGYNTLQEVELFKRKALKYKPDMVIVGFVENDWINQTRLKELIIKYREQLLSKGYSQREAEVKSPVLAAQEFYHESYSKFQELWEHTVFNPLRELKNYNLTVIIYLFPSGERETLFIKNTTQILGFHLVDGNYVFNNPKYSNYELFYKHDGHPTAVAHKLVGEQIYQYLKNNNLLPSE